ncbi:c-type cytochrome [Jannaschia sp.]|nr:c-type cytochrome [Jannaschia sp.]
MITTRNARRGRPGRGAIGLTCALTFAVPVQADYDPSQYPAYETCALCHGLFGVSHTAKFPNLAGQRPAYIEAQLAAFVSGERTNDGGQMSAIVTELQPEDFPVVVAWFSTQDPPAPTPAADTAPGGAVFADLGCGGCHQTGADGPVTVPYLTAQHPGYLAKQMTDFREGRRAARGAEDVHRAALSLPDETLAKIAAYLGAQERR